MNRAARRFRPTRFPAGGAAVIGAVFLFWMTSAAAAADIYYTSSLNGNLLGCDCWGYPEAGLDKRVLHLRKNPPAAGDLVLDAGNFLEEGRDAVLAGFILETYAELEYDAVAVGLNELAEGVDVLVERAGGPVPFLAHNLLIDGRPISPEPLIKDTGSEVFAVISLADPAWFASYLPLHEGRLSLSDPSAALADQRRRAGASEADAVILLAHGREEWARDLAAAAARGDGSPLAAVILAGEEKLIEDELPGGIPLVSPGEEGNRLGVLSIRLRRRGPAWRNEFIEFHYLDPGDRRTAARGAEYAAYLDEKRRD